MRAFIFFFVALVISPSCTWSGALAACIPNGTEVGINSALKVAGDTAVLCSGTTFLLNNPVTFTAANQQIYTTGLPTDRTRAILRINGSNLATAIMSYQSGTIIKNIQVDGMRPALGIVVNGAALIEIGGNSVNQVVDNVYTHDPRGWSCLHIIQGDVPGCYNSTISNNQVGPSGNPNQMWADGISLACRNSLVVNNTVTDATDGAIVIFGAPGSTIKNNVIIAATPGQVLLGGINMVDYGPFNGNYSGTLVLNNTINAQGALIKAGIAMGSQTWGCPTPTTLLFGSTVSGNTLVGANFGYGFPVNGVYNWTVTGNVDHARHVGVVSPGCNGTNVAQPAAFQYQNISKTVLQSGYVFAYITYVLGVTEPSILTVVKPATACGTFSANQGLLGPNVPNQTETSCDGRFAFTLQANGNLVLLFNGSTLWSTNTTGQNTAQALMQADGNFVMHNSTGDAIWATGTAGNNGAYLSIQNDGNLVIYNTSSKAIWNSGTCCH